MSPSKKINTKQLFCLQGFKIMLGISMFSDEHVTRKQISILFHFQNKKALFSFSPSKSFNYPFVRVFVDLRKPKIVWVPKKRFYFEEIPEHDGSVWRSGKSVVLEPINTSVVFQETSSTISFLWSIFIVKIFGAEDTLENHSKKIKSIFISPLVPGFFFFSLRAFFSSSQPSKVLNDVIATLSQSY